MNRATKQALVGTVIAALVALQATPLDAATATPVTVDVSASVTVRAELSLIRDVNSVTGAGRGSATVVVFNKFDDVDRPGIGNPNFMYAPYQTETGKNWHLASIVVNGSSMTLGATVTADVGSTILPSIMDVFFGGFFRTDGSSAGGTSGDWELLNTFSRTLNEPFVGSCPFNYRLRLLGVPGRAAPYTGHITFTLSSS